MVRFSQPPANLQRSYNLGNSINIPAAGSPLELLLNGYGDIALQVNDNINDEILLQMSIVDDEHANIFNPTGLGVTLGFDGADAPRIPSFTKAQRDNLSGRAGMIIWNTTTKQLNIFNGTAWKYMVNN